MFHLFCETECLYRTPPSPGNQTKIRWAIDLLTQHACAIPPPWNTCNRAASFIRRHRNTPSPPKPHTFRMAHLFGDTACLCHTSILRNGTSLEWSACVVTQNTCNVALELNIIWFPKLFVSHATISRAMVSCHRGAAEHAGRLWLPARMPHPLLHSSAIIAQRTKAHGLTQMVF